MGEHYLERVATTPKGKLSRRYYRVKAEGNDVVAEFGNIGSEKLTRRVKKLDSPADALAEASRMAGRKKREGFAEKEGAVVAGAASSNVDIFNGNDPSLPAPVVDLDDFAWSKEDEPHPARRKRLIKEYGKELTSLMGYDWRTKYVVLALMALQISLAGYLAEEAPFQSKGGSTGTLKFWAIVYVVGATATQSLFLAEHEISHNLAFREFWKNKVFGVFANLPMVLPFFISFKEYHNEHHKYQGQDGVDTDLPTPFEAKLLSNFFGKLFFLFNQTWFYAFRPLFIKPKPFTAWHAVNFGVQVAFIGAIVSAWGWGSLLYLLSCAHWAGSLHPMASHFVAEHYVFRDGVETASYYGPLNALCWNVGFHNEHHDFPKVPWSNLPKLRKLASKDYDTLPRHDSWPMVLIHFLMEPQYKLYNRVKRAAWPGK